MGSHIRDMAPRVYQPSLLHFTYYIIHFTRRSGDVVVLPVTYKIIS